MSDELVVKVESNIDKIAESKPKLSRLEREHKKLEDAKIAISQILAAEKSKTRKEETRDKILLGVILQGMISDGKIPSGLFDESLEKYITTDKDRDRCDAYYEKYSTWKSKV